MIALIVAGVFVFVTLVTFTIAMLWETYRSLMSMGD